jgi:hypothetical protein
MDANDFLLQDIAERRDIALDRLDQLENLPMERSVTLWIRHVGHINTEGSVGSACEFCMLRIDIDFRVPGE